MNKVLVLVGPTASGKSALAVELARKLNGEIISADSRQVYKGLDIGTGKITAREMKKIPHHLLDVVSAKKTFTANDFLRHGRRAIASIHKKGKLPIIVGGTGFYIDALLGKVQLADVPPNPKLRAELSNMTAWELYSLLREKDPLRAETIDQNNPVRLIRALEIAAAPPSKKETPAPNYDELWLGLNPDRSLLRKKIHERLLKRMRAGMLTEARKLHDKGLTFARMEDLGLEYRHLAQYLQKKISKQDMLEQLEAKIWQYAKRQMTYWNRNKSIAWFPSVEDEGLWALARHFAGKNQ
jgi:tRNA dimethylallyltransferase